MGMFDWRFGYGRVVWRILRNFDEFCGETSKEKASLWLN
jgi:hypothetical protein